MSEFAVHPRLSALVLYTRQFSALIDAGVSLMRCFQLLQETTDDPDLKAANTRFGEQISAGAQLSQAIAERHDLFPPFYVGFVRAGEIGGVLDEAFSYLADWLEQESEAAERLQTRVLLLRMASKVLGDTSSEKLEAEAQATLATARRAARIASFCRLFEMGLAAGVPMHLALTTAAGVLGEQEASHLRAGVEDLAQAQPIASLLAEVEDLRPVVAPLVSAGEETACLDDMLRSAAMFYDAEATHLLSKAFTLA